MLYAFVQKQKSQNSSSQLTITYIVGGRCLLDGDTVSCVFLVNLSSDGMIKKKSKIRGKDNNTIIFLAERLQPASLY